MAKVIAPLIVILLIVGFIYWGADGANSTAENPVAKGVAKFYAEVRQAVKPGSTRLDDYTIELAQPVKTVVERLEDRALEVTPSKPSWQGEYKKRSFKENETMKTALENFARDEGVEIIWDLQYDYIIKNHFAEKSDLKSLVDKVSRVVAGDFGGQVHSFYCPKERTLVLSGEPDRYLTDFCVTTKSTARQMREKQLEKQYQRERNNN